MAWSTLKKSQFKKLGLKAVVKNKYGAKATVIDGIRFASLLEARYCQRLKGLKESGHIALFLTQVPFRLPGGVTYRADFMVQWGPNEGENSGRLDFIDCKGRDTPMSLLKRKQVLDLYGVDVKIVTKA